MPSTYSPSLKIELIGNGEQTGTWGQTTNNNMGTLLEQAITGVGSLSLSGDYVLSNYNGLPDEARNAVLVFSGSLAAPANVVAPSVQKTYVVTNNAGANVTLKTSTGTGVVIGNGLSSLVYCDGSEFYTAVNVNNVIGNLAVSGNEIIAGSIVLGGNLTVSNTVAATNLSMVSNTSIVDMSVNTGALCIPVGTLAQRPSAPIVGMSRWNSTNGIYEVWNGIAWQIIASGTYSADYLIVGGGGGGGAAQNTYAGNSGGGAGGLVTTLGTSQISLSPGVTYSVAVGAGGASGAKGSNSSITGQTVAIGGGLGGYPSGGAGGSGGGLGGAGTSGQGFAGGASAASSDDGNSQSYAGGGGAGGAGQSASGGGASAAYPGVGGIGVANSITGAAVTYAGGGGGGSRGSPGASGGSGGGGAGGGSAVSGTAGTANTGGGGGGSGASNAGALGGAGGSGVVILSVPTTNYSGVTSGSPTITTSGSYTILKYTTSGSYTA
jgi:hypothetical protein